MSDVVYKYNAKKNPRGGGLPGVPLRDLDARDFESLPDWLKRSVEDAEFFTAPAPAKKTTRAKKGKPDLVNKAELASEQDNAADKAEGEK